MTDGSRRKAARRTRRLLALSAAAIVAGMALIVLTFFVRGREREEVTVRICRSQVAQNLVLRQVLLEARRQSLSRALNEAQINRIENVYRPLIRLVPMLECDSEGRPLPTRKEE